MGFKVEGVSLWDRMPGSLTSGDLLAAGYGAEGGFLITRMGELWCDSIPMYGFNGKVKFHAPDTGTTYTCSILKGALTLEKSRSPLEV